MTSAVMIRLDRDKGTGKDKDGEKERSQQTRKDSAVGFVRTKQLSEKSGHDPSRQVLQRPLTTVFARSIVRPLAASIRPNRRVPDSERWMTELHFKQEK